MGELRRINHLGKTIRSRGICNHNFHSSRYELTLATNTVSHLCSSTPFHLLILINLRVRFSARRATCNRWKNLDTTLRAELTKLLGNAVPTYSKTANRPKSKRHS